MQKYELTKETFKSASGKILYRIKAVRKISQKGRIVKKGTIGGYVESPANLSQEGEAWLADNAMSMGKTIIERDAWVGGNAVIFGNSVITDEADVWGDTFVDSSTIAGRCKVKDQGNVKDSTLSGEVVVQNKAYVEKCSMEGTINVMEKARVFASNVKGKALVFMGDTNADLCDIGGISTYNSPENVVIGGKSNLMRAQVFGKDIAITGDARLENNVILLGNEIRISDHADIYGKVEILSNVNVTEVAVIRNKSDMPLYLDDMEINGDTLIEQE